MKVSASRKSKKSIMCNQHFGKMVLKREDLGIEMTIPPEWITPEGKIKDFALKLWTEKIREAEAKQKKVI